MRKVMMNLLRRGECFASARRASRSLRSNSEFTNQRCRRRPRSPRGGGDAVRPRGHPPPRTFVGQQRSKSVVWPGSSARQPRAIPAFWPVEEAQDSLRASGVPWQSESVRVSAGSVQPETFASFVPLTVVGQHTSLSPAFSRTQPAATAAVVSLSSEQSSLRGVPVFPAQSLPVSASSFCRHATVPDGDGPPESSPPEDVPVVVPDEHAAVIRSPTREGSARRDRACI